MIASERNEVSVDVLFHISMTEFMTRSKIVDLPVQILCAEETKEMW